MQVLRGKIEGLHLGDIILYLGELGPPPGKTGLTEGTRPSPANSLEEVTFPTTLSFGGVNLPLREKTLFLEEYFLNFPASFFLGVVNLSHGGVGLSTTFSLGGTNPSLREFILPFGESLISLENRLGRSLPYCIPFTKFLCKTRENLNFFEKGQNG